MSDLCIISVLASRYFILLPNINSVKCAHQNKISILLPPEQDNQHGYSNYVEAVRHVEDWKESNINEIPHMPKINPVNQVPGNSGNQE